MADIEIIEDEGVSFVKITLSDEMIRAERGALSFLMGDIRINARLPPVSGNGKVVLKSRGPVQEIDLDNDNDRIVADGRHVLARTEGISYKIRRAATNPITSLLSGERKLRVYEGTGKILLSSYPYWRYLLLAGEEIK